MKILLDTVKFKDGSKDQDGFTHIRSAPQQVGITLCGWVDVLGLFDTNDPVDCPTCLAIFNYCNKGEIEVRERRTKP